MGECVIDVTATSAAAPEAVFALLRDATTWSTWGDWRETGLEQAAPGADPHGVGAIRRFRRGRTITRERVVALDPDRRLGYELLEGLPLDGYRAEVTLAPTASGGTTIRWRSTFRPSFPGTGWALRRGLGGFIAKTAERLAAAAERDPATTA